MAHTSKRTGQNPPKRTAVIYARFSCSKQREASIEDQLRVCEEWCESTGYRVIQRYTDSAISGRTDDRPAFQQMIEHAGESEIVLVYMMDRFSRDAYDAPMYKKRLSNKGVRVVSATEAMPDGPEAILIEKIYEGMAAVESAHISVRTKRGMAGNALKCMHNGVKLFGYDLGDDGHYHINEAQADIVREVYDRAIAMETNTSIARDLARRGVVNYRNRPATAAFVSLMLRNEKYTGVYKFGDVRVEGGMPAIISATKFRNAQNRPSRRGRHLKGDWRNYPLSGKMICADCGRSLVGSSCHNHSGKRYDYYICRKGCKGKYIRADVLENVLVEILRAMLADRDTALEIADLVCSAVNDGKREKRIEAARAEAARAQRGIDNLVNAIAMGLDASVAMQKMESLRRQVEEANATVHELEEQGEFVREDFADFLQYGTTLTDEKLLNLFIHDVKVSRENVTVSLAYATEKHEPAYENIEAGSCKLVWLPYIASCSDKKRRVNIGVQPATKMIYLRFPRCA